MENRRRVVSVYDYPEHLNPFSENYMSPFAPKYYKNKTWSSKLSKKLNRSVSWIEKSLFTGDDSSTNERCGSDGNRLPSHDNVSVDQQRQTYSNSDKKVIISSTVDSHSLHGNGVETREDKEEKTEVPTVRRRRKKRAPLPPNRLNDSVSSATDSANDSTSQQNISFDTSEDDKRRQGDRNEAIFRNHHHYHERSISEKITKDNEKNIENDLDGVSKLDDNRDELKPELDDLSHRSDNALLKEMDENTLGKVGDRKKVINNSSDNNDGSNEHADSKDTTKSSEFNNENKIPEQPTDSDETKNRDLKIEKIEKNYQTDECKKILVIEESKSGLHDKKIPEKCSSDKNEPSAKSEMIERLHGEKEKDINDELTSKITNETDNDKTEQSLNEHSYVRSPRQGTSETESTENSKHTEDKNLANNNSTNNGNRLHSNGIVISVQ